MNYLIAIDVGFRNLGMCVYSFEDNRVIYWRNCALMSGRYQPKDTVRYVVEFVARHKQFFDGARTVLIERQMRPAMRIIEAAFETLFYGRAVVLCPRSVKNHWKLCSKNYSENKRKAVAWAGDFVEENIDTFDSEPYLCWKSAKKRDDMADALLTLMFYLDTYSNQLGS